MSTLLNFLQPCQSVRGPPLTDGPEFDLLQTGCGLGFRIRLCRRGVGEIRSKCSRNSPSARIPSTTRCFIEYLSCRVSHVTPETIMSTALDITKQAYEAFGRRDIQAFLKLVADEVDWKLIGPASWPHAGLRRNPAEVAAFFADLDRFDDLTLFEPREFIEAGENVTVLGYLESFARETKQKYHSDWVHVSTVRNGKITRWRGFANTAAPYGYL
jgi:ketosteroid isomerase-like protein